MSLLTLNGPTILWTVSMYSLKKLYYCQRQLAGAIISMSLIFWSRMSIDALTLLLNVLKSAMLRAVLVAVQGAVVQNDVVLLG